MGKLRQDEDQLFSYEAGGHYMGLWVVLTNGGKEAWDLQIQIVGTLLEVAITTLLVLQNHDRTSLMGLAEDRISSM